MRFLLITLLTLGLGGLCSGAGLSPIISDEVIANNLLILPACSSSVVDILNSKRPIGVRLHAVRILGIDLTSSDTSALCNFLVSLPEADEQNLPGLRALKNDVMHLLQEQAEFSANLETVLIDVYQNPRQDDIVRDYALQHLASCVINHDRAASTQVVKILKSAIKQEVSSAGTALLGLHRLDQRFHFYGAATDECALELLDNSSSSTENRVTAAQICSERHVFAAIPALESLAQGAGSIALRVAAVRAVADLGGEKEIPLLRQLSLEKAKAVRVAATAGLNKKSVNGIGKS